MKIFKCGNCKNSVFFENHSCENCGHLTGYRDEDRKMLTFDATIKKLISDREQVEYKFCKNNEHDACNWVLEKESPEEFCKACQLNRTIPNLANIENVKNWKNLEVAKHRLVYQLQKIGLPLVSQLTTKDGLCFDFVARQDNPSLMTGHANGVVTILIREGDSVVREKTRKELLEPYRTLVGHLRHEVGHYFWDVLIRDNPKILQKYRAIFGDESADYGEALETYYKNGAPEDWQKNFISTYATSHPWEDWAETWAHYLHIMDMVETAYFFRLNVKPKGVQSKELKTKVSFDPYSISDFNAIVKTAVPLSFAVNSLNRSMGIPDVYPFVISAKIVEKLKFIHHLLLPYRKH